MLENVDDSGRWLKKKLTDVTIVRGETRQKVVEGVLVADKVGEVKYIGLDKLRREGIRQPPPSDGKQQEGDDSAEEAANTLFG